MVQAAYLGVMPEGGTLVGHGVPGREAVRAGEAELQRIAAVSGRDGPPGGAPGFEPGGGR